MIEFGMLDSVQTEMENTALIQRDHTQSDRPIFLQSLVLDAYFQLEKFSKLNAE